MDHPELRLKWKVDYSFLGVYLRNDYEVMVVTSSGINVYIPKAALRLLPFLCGRRKKLPKELVRLLKNMLLY